MGDTLLDPTQLLQLPNQANPLPASSPVQPQGQSSPLDLASIVSQVSNLPQYQQPVSQLSDVYRQEGDIAQQQSQLEQSPPKTRWQPHYEPVTGAGSFLRDAGKGILQALSLTGPGQHIQNALYGPGVQSWERQREMLANKLATLKGQQEVPTEELRGLTGLTQAGGLAAYRGGELQNQRARIEAYQQSVNNRLMMGLKSLDLKSLMTGSQMELNKARTMLDQVLSQVAPERLQLEQYGIDANNATRQSVANTLSQLGMDKSHPVAQMLDSLLGTNLMPAAPMNPGGAQPVQGQSPLPKSGGKPNQPNKPTAKASQFKVGQQVNVGKKTMTVIAVYPDGSFDAR